MTATNFKKLSLNIQTCFLWAEGHQICSTLVKNSTIKLYTIYGFFVEVKFKTQSEDIEEINVLQSQSDLLPYLDAIELPDDILF